MNDEQTEAVDTPRVAAALSVVQEFQGRSGTLRMIALADEFQRMCVETEKRGRAWLVRMGPGRHARIEAWQYLGQRAGVTARVIETRDVRHPLTGDYEGVTAVAEAIIMATGQAITRAECDCYADEVQKRRDGKGVHQRWLDPAGKPNRQAIKGMAQTRACSRALAGALRFIMELAGVEGTPAEEMDGVDPEAITPRSGARTMPAHEAGAADRSKETLFPPAGDGATAPTPNETAAPTANGGADDTLFLDGIVRGVTVGGKGERKTKDGKGAPWTRYVVRLGLVNADGIETPTELSTFSATDAEDARLLIGRSARAYYEVKGQYRNLTGIKAIGVDAPAPDPDKDGRE